MKNKIIIIVFLGGALFASAQKGNWTIGLYTGVQGQVITSCSEEYHNGTIINSWDVPNIRPKHSFSNIPPFELNVKYNIRNRFSFIYGVGYRSYFTKVKNSFELDYTARTDFLQLPVIFQYDIPLRKKGFSFFLQWGVCFDFNIYQTSWGNYPTEYHDSFTNKLLSVETSVNVPYSGVWINYLFHTGFGFSYQFNSGIGISISGKHNIGLANISELSYHMQLKDPQIGNIEREIKEKLLCRSESWNILFGVTYTFKKKEK